MTDVSPLRFTTPPAAAEPLLVDARSLARMLCVGIRTVRAWDASGRIPEPIRLSPGCVRWRYSEVSDWVSAGCPPREVWARLRAAHK